MNSRSAAMPLSWFALLAIFVAGCSSRDPTWKETVPVKGALTVDGKAEMGVEVRLTSVALAAKEGFAAEPLPSKAMTDAAGAFALSTYEIGDGAPPGEYVVTFAWPTMNMITLQYEGDRFNGKYSDEKTAEKRIKVESGKPLDLGRIELTTE